MAKRQYTGAYLAIRKAWAPVVARGDAQCHEPTCLKPSRAIAPGSPWDLSHNHETGAILGPSHRGCNRSEGAARGNRARAPRFLQL